MENFRTYGVPPYTIILVHGGPGGSGEMKDVAEKLLEHNFSVLEPIQTKTSLWGQVYELRHVIEEQAPTPIVLVGYSWGAWLSCLVAEKYPHLVKKLLLISSGSFDESYCVGMQDTRMKRLTQEEQSEVKALLENIDNIDQKSFKRFGSLMSKADSYDFEECDDNDLNFDYNIFKKVWPEASYLRKSGELLKISSRIKCPVVAIHGKEDPHLAIGVKDPLSSNLKKFTFVEIEKSGHTPWKERQAKDKFFKILINELRD